MANKRRHGRPPKNHQPPPPDQKMRVAWKLPRAFTQLVALKAAAKQMWVEDFVRKALDEYMKEDC